MLPAGQQALVQQAIAGVLSSEGAAVAVNLATGATSGGTVDLGDIQAAVRAVPQCSGALVLLPADNITTAIGQLPALNACAFADTGNAGNGVVSAIAVGGGATNGSYTVALTSATAFTVHAPGGGSLGSGTVGTPFTGGGLTFTVAAQGRLRFPAATASPSWYR